MANFTKIFQGTDRNKDAGNVKFSFVNTSINDEHVMIKRMFLPLLTQRKKFSQSDDKKFNLILDRFFDKGTFLFQSQYDFLNELLDDHGFEQVALKNDGCYFQPIEPGKKSPSAKSWKQNGAARYRELEKAISDYKRAAVELKFEDDPAPEPSAASRIAGLIG